MKFLAFILFGLIQLSTAVAQSPSTFQYQAIAQNAEGDLLSNANIGVRISILAGDANGMLIYSETHSVISDERGIFRLEVGGGNLLSGEFGAIQWGNADHFMKVDLDLNGGSDYAFFGTNQLLSVPYALHANSATNTDDADADPTNELQQIALEGTTLSITDGGSVELPTGAVDGDTDPTNELQDLKRNGDTIRLSNSSNYVIDAFEDGDTDSNNEIQQLSLNGNMLELTNGGSVALPMGGIDADADPNNELQTLSFSGSTLSISDGNSVKIPVCVDSSMIDPGVSCPLILQPVCGCNQVTYSNACLATANGVTNFVAGACPEQIWEKNESVFLRNDDFNPYVNFAPSQSTIQNQGLVVEVMAPDSNVIDLPRGLFVRENDNQFSSQLAPGSIFLSEGAVGGFILRTGDLATHSYNFSSFIDENGFLKGSWGKDFFTEQYPFQTYGRIQSTDADGNVKSYLGQQGDEGIVSIVNADNTITGSMCFSGGGSVGFCAVSDRAVKENIDNIAHLLPQILKLQPRTYNYVGYDEPSIGFIAQEVQALFPDMVQDMNGKLGIDYLRFTTLSIQAIKEQQAIIDTSTKQITSLEKRLKVQQAEIDNLREMVEKIIQTKD